MIDTFLEEAPRQLTALRDAVDRGDSGEARRAAHTLKSNAATFGAGSLSDVCRELEAATGRGELDGATRVLLEQAEQEWEPARDALRQAGAP